MWNNLKTALLLGSLTAVFLFIGRALGGTGGMAIALVFAMLTNLVSWWFSDRIVLAMYRARQVSAGEAPELYGIVADLARRAEMPMPKVYIIPDHSPNAFATGRDPAHAAVAVTEGILRLLPRDELRGVLAHELGHVANRDTLISVVAASMAGAISLIADIARWGLIFGGGRDDREGSPAASLALLIVAPIAAMIIQLAVSRSREYAADAWAAKLIGGGEPLARALQRISLGVAQLPGHATPSTAHLFIVNPFSARGLMALFSTHPPAEERIRRLLTM